MRITVEPPRKKKDIIQCTRCQVYGHSKTYCTRPYKCVKCGGSHNSIMCQKPKNTPAKCALCEKDHPANYKGCTVYRDLQNMRSRPTNIRQSDNPSQPPVAQTVNQVIPQPVPRDNTYADALLGGKAQQPNNFGDQLNHFLTEFKAMFTQLISQNSMILNMLSTVINKLAH